MKVVTIATDLGNTFLQQLLIPSCRSVGLDLVILHVAHDGFRFRDKRTALVAYLTERADPNELIVFTDAYDTLFLRGEREIRAVYDSFPQPVVFSAEPNCWPLSAIGLALEQTPPVRPYPYLNSGGFIGPAGEILALCTAYPKPPSNRFPLLQHLRLHDCDTDERFGFSDQYYWSLVRLLEADTIGLDHQAVLFENFGPTVADVWDPNIKIGIKDFFARGREAPSYQRERERLEARLCTPSAAAQVHFASIITKAVVFDLFTEGRLPEWLCGFGNSAPTRESTVEVKREGLG